MKSKTNYLFAKYYKELHTLSRQTDTLSNSRKLELLILLHSEVLPQTAVLSDYANDLLFLLAYPSNNEMQSMCEAELNRIFHVCELANRRKSNAFLYNSGIPGSLICASYSLEINRWLVSNFKENVGLDSFEGDTYFVQTILNSQLEPLMQETLTEERSTWSFFDKMNIPQQQPKFNRLQWMIRQLDAASIPPTIADSIFTQFGTYTQWKTTANAPSLYSLRLPGKVHWHQEPILKRAELASYFEDIKPHKLRLQEAQQAFLCDAAKASMCSLLRETDTFTNAHIPETELWDLGRGVSIALYFMKPNYKMALESYAGFLLFKNGIPCAYGGGWILYRQSGFGVNVLPPFRGGESADLVCRLLCLYKHRFGSETFIVDPYQIGKNNSDGIQSAAFWFYYRLGFRPQQPDLAELATNEWKQIQANKTYRSKRTVLLKLAHSTMILGGNPIQINAIANHVTRYVQQHADGIPGMAQKKFMQQNRTLSLTASEWKQARPLLNFLASFDLFSRLPAQKQKELIRICALKSTSEAEFTRAVLENKTFVGIFESLRHISE